MRFFQGFQFEWMAMNHLPRKNTDILYTLHKTLARYNTIYNDYFKSIFTQKSAYIHMLHELRLRYISNRTPPVVTMIYLYYCQQYIT